MSDFICWSCKRSDDQYRMYVSSMGLFTEGIFCNQCHHFFLERAVKQSRRENLMRFVPLISNGVNILTWRLIENDRVYYWKYIKRFLKKPDVNPNLPIINFQNLININI